MVGHDTLDVGIGVRIPAQQHMDNLISTIQYIAKRSNKLKNQFTTETSAPIEFLCIFCQNEKEYSKFTKEIEPIGKIVEETSTGFTYLLNDPINTNSGLLRLVKIRKLDPARQERGDADFNTDYKRLKEQYINNPNFELVKRESFEMLRLSDSHFDVMTCFSSIPKSKSLEIKV